MRIYIAAVVTETNTFVPFPTGERQFKEGALCRGPACAQGDTHAHLVLRCFHERAQAAGHEVVFGLAALAEPAGPTVQAVYEAFREEIVDDLRSKGPFDIVLLYLHGAMVATGYDDCEGDLLAHVRRAAGRKTVVGVEIDPHCHLTDAMMRNADITIAMKEYPHTDFLERAAVLFDLCDGTAAGRFHPTAAVFDCRMVGLYPTVNEPMAGLVRALRAAETRPGILSVSFVHGFPWGDTPDTGSKIIVIADGDPSKAAAAASELGHQIYAMRDALLPRCPDIGGALDEALATPGRTILADTGDNPGGGAPGDNVSLLRAMLDRNLDRAAFSSIWDPQAAQICADAGVGATLALRFGGKSGSVSGDPLDAIVTVRAVREAHDQAGLSGARAAMGLSAWVECGGIDIVINSLRVQTFSPDALTGLGIDLAGKRLIAVKSANHFRANFAPLANSVITVATPGALRMDFAALPYAKKRDLAFHPRVADPLAAGTPDL